MSAACRAAALLPIREVPDLTPTPAADPGAYVDTTAHVQKGPALMSGRANAYAWGATKREARAMLADGLAQHAERAAADGRTFTLDAELKMTERSDGLWFASRGYYLEPAGGSAFTVRT